jgi:hypothetical protein
MNTDVDHNATCTPVAKAGTVVTLGDVRAAIESDAIPDRRKKYLCWALNRTITLIGNGVADVRAEPKTVLRQLDQLSPAMTGLSPRSFANLKTLVRAAFRLFESRLAPARSRMKLKGAWAALEAKLPPRLKRNLSRFMRFAQGMGWAPDEIGEEHMDRFGQYLRHEAMLDKADAVVRATRYAWNEAVDTVPAWPIRRVAPPPSKRTPYWLRPDELPASLRQELQDYLHRLGHPDPFVGPGSRILRPGTVMQYRHMLIMLASALVRSGVPVEQLTSISVLIGPDHVKRGCSFSTTGPAAGQHLRPSRRIPRPSCRRSRRIARAGPRPPGRAPRLGQSCRPAQAGPCGQESDSTRTRRRSGIRVPAGHAAFEVNGGRQAEHLAQCRPKHRQGCRGGRDFARLLVAGRQRD